MKVAAIVGSIRKESYNLKLANAIDWLSRVDRVMIGKPSWIVGSSMGLLGSVKAQCHLRDILFASGISSPLLPGNEVYVGLVHERFDEKGELTDEPTRQYLDLVAENFVNWMKEQARLKQLQTAK